MNKARRKAIAELVATLSDLLGKLEDAQASTSAIAEEEREYYDNMPESLQGGDKGQAASDSADALEAASESISESMSTLEDAITSLENIE